MSSIEPTVALPERPHGAGSARVRALRFGALFGGVLALVGFLLARRADPSVAGPYVLSAGVAVFLLALASPRAALALEAAWLRAAAVLGRVNGAILLTVIYVVVVTPLGLLFRLVQRRTFAAPRTGTTFVTRKTERDPRHFERPY